MGGGSCCLRAVPNSPPQLHPAPRTAQYTKKLDSRVSELRSFVTEDEHALSVIQDEAMESYRVFEAGAPRCDGRRLAEAGKLAASLEA